MPANYKYDLVGVLGYPVSENPTGIMQEAAFASAGLSWRYLAMEVKPEALADAMRGIRALGLRGVNLTIPHKVAVMQYLDEISPEAKVIGAVNTVRRERDLLMGENTDGKGFLRGVRMDAGMDPSGKQVVIIGAGGAARAIATELVLAGTREIIVLNRSAQRARQMVNDLRHSTGGNLVFEPWPDTYRVPPGVDLLVNATPVGLCPDVNGMPRVDLCGAKRDMLVCDAVFNPPETRLLKAAKDRGLPTLDGLSMLVYQGVIGFRMWTGQDPDEAAMKHALRRALGV